MPFVAVPSVKLGVTVRPPDTARSSVTVKVSASPSVAEVSATVSVGTVPSHVAVATTFCAGPVFTPSVAASWRTVTVTFVFPSGVTSSV